MRVNPYSDQRLVRHVVDLLNDPPASAAELTDRWRAAGMPLERPATGADLRVVRRYLAGWAELVDAATEPERVAVLNRLLARHATPPVVTDHDGSGWHLHHRPDGAGFAAMFTGSTASAAARHLTERGMHRLGRCALPECRRAFSDHSRPGRQRYCSHACANRDAVRRHRTTRGATLVSGSR